MKSGSVGLTWPLENNQFPLSLKVIVCSSSMIRVDVFAVCCLLLSAVTSSISSIHSGPLAVIHVHITTLTPQQQFQPDLQLLLLNFYFPSYRHTFKWILSQLFLFCLFVSLGIKISPVCFSKFVLM